jgi:CRISPR/Cas system endoribonuclease Cas6 (RAMP superfamily)
VKKFRFVRVSNYNNIYSVIVDDETSSLFDKFLNKFQNKHLAEVTELAVIINQISIVGVRAIQTQKKFKFQSPPSIYRLVNNSQLKLYAIKRDGHYLILGSGDFKKYEGAWQLSPKLRKVIKPLEVIDKYIKRKKLNWAAIEKAVRDKTTFIIR